VRRAAAAAWPARATIEAGDSRGRRNRAVDRPGSGVAGRVEIISGPGRRLGSLNAALADDWRWPPVGQAEHAARLIAPGLADGSPSSPAVAGCCPPATPRVIRTWLAARAAFVPAINNRARLAQAARWR